MMTESDGLNIQPVLKEECMNQEEKGKKQEQN